MSSNTPKSKPKPLLALLGPPSTPASAWPNRGRTLAMVLRGALGVPDGRLHCPLGNKVLSWSTTAFLGL